VGAEEGVEVAGALGVTVRVLAGEWVEQALAVNDWVPVPLPERVGVEEAVEVAEEVALLVPLPERVGVEEAVEVAVALGVTVRVLAEEWVEQALAVNDGVPEGHAVEDGVRHALPVMVGENVGEGDAVAVKGAVSDADEVGEARGAET
jgi:hypothetical protein